MSVPLEIRPATNVIPARSNLIAVASGKGGVGKTWFSITFAHTLALHGQKILLFDGDLGLANVDVQLGITPRRDLGSFLNGQCSLAETAARFGAGNFDIIAGRSGSGSLGSVAPSRLAALRADIDALGNEYDFVILDMGAGIERTVRTFATQARTCMIVTTDEPTAITDAYAFIKVTAAERPDSDFRVVVNLANSDREGEQTFHILRKACREFLKIEPKLAGVIRRDPRVAETIRKQSSLMTRYPNADAATDVEALTSRFLLAF